MQPTDDLSTNQPIQPMDSRKQVLFKKKDKIISSIEFLFS